MTSIDAQNSGFHELAPKWGWFVALGIVLIIVGGFALADTLLITLLSVMFIGAALIVGGIFQIVHAFANKAWRSFIFALLCGVLYIIAGLLIMDEPARGSVVITIFLLVALSVGGVVRIMVAIRHRDVKGWWLLVVTGIITIGLSLALYLTLPWSSLWLLGTIVAIELIFHGAAWIRFGLALRTSGV